VREIDGKQLLPVILDLAAAINSLRLAAVLLAANRKTEAIQELSEVGEDLDKILSAAQKFVDQASADDAV
jgi:hypothetical protein